MYIVFDTIGVIRGCYEDYELALFLADNNGEIYCQITKELANFLEEQSKDSNMGIYVDVNKVKDDALSYGKDNDDFLINDIKYFRIINENEFYLFKSNLVWRMVRSSNNAIFNGKKVNFITGEEMFTFTPMDQIELRNILNTYDGDKKYILYKNYTGGFGYYSYENLKFIYKELFNHKVFHTCYLKVLCDWIEHNITEETIKNIDFNIEYGYSNDFIERETSILYETQKIC